VNGCADCEQKDSVIDHLTDQVETMHAEITDLRERYEALKGVAETARDNVTAAMEALDNHL
jgi:outer membrane murein-binding lipoprotein Lpp